MEYIRTLLGAVALLSIATALLPSRESIRRAALSAFSVILLLLLIPKDAPFSFEDVFTIPEEGAVTESAPAYGDAWREGVENGIRLDLCEKYALSPAEVSVMCQLKNEENEITVTHLSLTLRGESALADATGMLRYIEKSYGVYAEIHLKA